MTTTADKITQVCDGVKQMLLDKNAAYGDSVSNPLRVFSKADKLEAIRVRIDDKLSRISRGGPYPGDNDVRDLVGYLLLYLVNDGTETGQGESIPQPSYAPAAPLRVIDRDGDVWEQQPNGRYACATLRHLGEKEYSWLREHYGPVRYTNMTGR